MRLPAMHAARTLSAGFGGVAVATSAITGAAEDSVKMAGVLDDLWGGIKSVGQGIGGFVTEKAPCVAACGIEALSCIHCTTNLGCWAKCASPKLFPCIARCLR